MLPGCRPLFVEDPSHLPPALASDFDTRTIITLVLTAVLTLTVYSNLGGSGPIIGLVALIALFAIRNWIGFGKMTALTLLVLIGLNMAGHRAAVPPGPVSPAERKR